MWQSHARIRLGTRLDGAGTPGGEIVDEVDNARTVRTRAKKRGKQYQKLHGSPAGRSASASMEIDYSWLADVFENLHAVVEGIRDINPVVRADGDAARQAETAGAVAALADVQQQLPIR